nr:unnamed protein product [Naegleria fowleri]
MGSCLSSTSIILEHQKHKQYIAQNDTHSFFSLPIRSPRHSAELKRSTSKPKRHSRRRGLSNVSQSQPQPLTQAPSITLSQPSSGAPSTKALKEFSKSYLGTRRDETTLEDISSLSDGRGFSFNSRGSNSSLVLPKVPSTTSSGLNKCASNISTGSKEGAHALLTVGSTLSNSDRGVSLKSISSHDSKGKLLVPGVVENRRLSTLESGSQKHLNSSTAVNEDSHATLATRTSQKHVLNEQKEDPSKNQTQQPSTTLTPVITIPSSKNLSHLKKRRNTDVTSNVPRLIVYDTTNSSDYLTADRNENTTSDNEEDEDCYIFADSFYFGSFEEIGNSPSKSRSFNERNKNPKVIHAFSLRQGIEVPDSDSDDTDSQSSGISQTFSFSSSNVSDCYNSSHLGAFATEDEMRRFEMDEYINLRTIIANEELEQLKLYEFPPWAKRFSSENDEAKDDDHFS